MFFHLSHVNWPIFVKARNIFYDGFLSHEINVSARQQKSQAKY